MYTTYILNLEYTFNLFFQTLLYFFKCVTFSFPRLGLGVGVTGYEGRN